MWRGNRKWKMGNGKWGIGNGKWGMGFGKDLRIYLLSVELSAASHGLINDQESSDSLSNTLLSVELSAASLRINK